MIYGLKLDKDLSYMRKPGETVDLSESQLIAKGAFENGDDAQLVDFGETVSARYICIESLSSHSGDNHASIAEIDLIDAANNWLNRDGWQVIYADSEELIAEPAAAGNIIDNQPVTIWHTRYQGEQSSIPHPHQVVIDLGRVQNFRFLRYLPRNGPLPGKIKDYRIYADRTPFKGLSAE